MEPIAQPGNVAATDIAFARAARDDGTVAAFGDYAADVAVIHLASGITTADDWLASHEGDGSVAGWPVDWTPRSVWSSCDGSLAVNFGRTQSADGSVGSYVTAWRRQRDGSYRWTYYLTALDDPQPPRRIRQETPTGEDVIVVPGLDAIDGKAADCVRGTGPRSAPVAPPDGAPEEGNDPTIAKDGTLRYRWEQQAAGRRRVVVDYLRDGRWQVALDFIAPAAPMGLQ